MIFHIAAMWCSVGSDAPEPFSFMNVRDAMCQTTMSAGSRRGAILGTLRCNHPDIEACIDTKHEPAKLRMFNLLVLVTNAFVMVVRQDDRRDLGLRRDSPQNDPGPRPLGPNHALYVGYRQARHHLYRSYQFRLQSVLLGKHLNDQLLRRATVTTLWGPAYLAPSIFVSEPFTTRAQLDTAALDASAPIAVRMLDNPIGVSRFPLEAQRVKAFANVESASASPASLMRSPCAAFETGALDRSTLPATGLDAFGSRPNVRPRNPRRRRGLSTLRLERRSRERNDPKIGAGYSGCHCRA